MNATATDLPRRDRRATGGPWYAAAAFWTGPFTIGLALLVAVGLGLAWYLLGGFPRDHDRYGSVSVPGQRVVELPAGDVRVNFENDTTGDGDTRHIQDRPPGMTVRVSPAAGGEAIEVKNVPGWLFSSISGDRGHEPFGKVEIPRRGNYRVRVTEDQSRRVEPAASRTAPGTESGPEIALGERPWSPLDSLLVGAILAGLTAFLALLLLTLPVRLLT